MSDDDVEVLAVVFFFLLLFVYDRGKKKKEDVGHFFLSLSHSLSKISNIPRYVNVVIDFNLLFFLIFFLNFVSKYNY
jgi:hypothetical protein